MIEFFFWTLVVLGGLLWALSKIDASKTPEQRASAKKAHENRTFDWTYGARNTQMVCSHCNTKGQIFTKEVKQKKGVSGGKAVGALLTGGASLLVVGLSRKEKNTQAHCDNCNSTWHF